MQKIISQIMIVVLLLVFSTSAALADAAAASISTAGQSVTGTVQVHDEAIPADGTSQTVVTVHLKDPNGNDLSISPEKVKLTTSLGTLDPQVSASVYGQYTSILTAPLAAGVAFISAEVDGIWIPDMARVNFIPGAVSPTHTVIAANHQSLPANGFSRTVISVFLKDSHGNAIAAKADSLQLSTTLGQLSDVTHETYGHYEMKLVSPVYGSLARLTENPGSTNPLEIDFEQETLLTSTPNNSRIPATLSVTYETYGVYKAILTAPLSAGIAEIKGSINGTPIGSSAYVAFTEASSQDALTGLNFTQPSYSMKNGQQLSTVLEATYSNGDVRNVSVFAAYTMTNPSVASVDSSGKVQGHTAGQTVLTATYGGFAAETRIIVETDNHGNIDNPPPNPGDSTPPSTPPPGLVIEVIPKGGQSGQKGISLEDVKKGVIVLSTAPSGGQVNITAANLKQLKAINEQAVLEIQAGRSSMILPVSELDLQAFSRKFGFPEDSIRLEIMIREPEPIVAEAIQQSGQDIKARLLTPPLEFEVLVTGASNQKVFISSFNRFVSRTLPMGSGPIPATATGVRWVPETRQFKFVPTFFEWKDGQWSAVMKRQGASIYTVIDRPVSFQDSKGHWSAADIELLASKLIVEGRTKEAFDPDAAITRAEIAALAVRSLGLNDSEEKSPFPDTVGGWYEKAVSTAYQAGLISGYEDGTFRPMQRITREELVGVLVRAMQYTAVQSAGSGSSHKSFTDEPAISRWALDDVRFAMQSGIIEGDENGAFRAGSYTSRAEAVTMLKRMLKLIQFI
ncbi:invasin domain 3-containing protein [Paenibacillus sp. MBLB4367]|uniref:invasin domain 3-containing protein n=1 Tax=Paenibacillus sp. MBLB4367 TaxID=3384767 RepID=UPI003907FE6F